MDVDIIALGNDIIKQVDIVEIISSFVEVTKKGRQYVSLCPFHADSNPSMMISKEKQIYHCFVCGAGGNAINFVQKFKKISYFEAIKTVAEIANIQDPRLEINKKPTVVNEGLQTLYKCSDELNKFYAYCLHTDEGKIALDYLHNRGISDEQIKKFQLGYSLKDGTKTVSYLQAKTFSLKNIEDIGICFAKASGTSDNNAGRLIFPIHNQNGNVIGYSARRLTEDKEISKFVNSPETKLFHKSNVLYNLANAMQVAKQKGYIYIVEGFMDVFALDSIGEGAVVALMGTAFTKENAEFLKKLRVEVRLCLDGDEAGQHAMMAAMNKLEKAKVPFRIVYQEGNIKDPDEILKQDGPEALKNYINQLHDSFNFATSYYIRTGNNGSVEDRRKIVNYFLPTLLAIEDEFIFNDYCSKLAKATGFELSTITKLVKKNKGKQEEIEIHASGNLDGVVSLFPKERKAIKRLLLAEKSILVQMLNYKEAVKYYSTNIDYLYDSINRLVADFIQESVLKNNNIDVNEIINEINASENETAKKEDAVNKLVTLSMEKPLNNTYSEVLMDDYKKVIDEELEKNYKKDTLEKALEGKTAQDKARILNEYVKSNKK